MRTYSLPWLMAIHFWPRTWRRPFCSFFTTTTVTSPVSWLLCALSPLPSKELAPLMSVSKMLLPLIVTGLPMMVGLGMLMDVFLDVVVLELFDAAVLSTR